MAKFEVYASAHFEKQLRKVPLFIQEAVAVWIASVEEEGVAEIRKLKGYHDEPLKGARSGQRSVRLNRAYRLIYREEKGSIVIVLLEIHKHDY